MVSCIGERMRGGAGTLGAQMQWGCIRSGWGSSDATNNNMHEHPLHEQTNANGICTLSKAYQITSDVLLTSTLLSFFRFVSETFAIEANNSNNHCRAIFGNQSHGHELEQHFELELLFLV